jgi:transcription elongation GreA/GreB family factor
MRDRLFAELDELAPDAWPTIAHRVEARRRSAALLEALERPPAARSRRYVELRLRLESMRLREVA